MSAKPEYVKLATAKTVETIERSIDRFWCSKDYRVDPETLAITHATREPPPGYVVVRYRGGFLFAFERKLSATS